MTLALVGLILGAALGAWRAQRAKGNRLDMAQYAAAHGIAFALAGMILTTIIVRIAG